MLSRNNRCLKVHLIIEVRGRLVILWGENSLITFLEGMSENFSDKNTCLKLSLLFSQQEKQKQTSKKHIIFSRKRKVHVLESAK